jgi:hypothetical protein
MATAFLSKPGFKPVKHLNGSPYNGQANMYVVGANVTLVPGDVVTIDGTGNASGLPTCTIGTAAAIPCGVVVGVVNAKFDPVLGKMTSGSVLLDTPQTAVQGSYVLVADSPDLVMETEIATYVQADVNLNFELVPTTYDTTTGNSNMKIIYNGGESTDPFKLLGTPQKDQAFPAVAGTSAAGYGRPAATGDTNVKVLVAFNTHQYKGTTGTAGV